MTPGLRNILHDLAARDPNGMGIMLDASPDRVKAVRLGLIVGKQMKVGHNKKYQLTASGRAAVMEAK